MYLPCNNIHVPYCVCTQKVKNEYKHAREGPYQVITFDSQSDSITLDIPLDGKTIINGWKLIPLVYPEVILMIKLSFNICSCLDR